VIDDDSLAEVRDWELLFLLGMAFQLVLRDFVARTGAAGYPDLRPVHGLIFQCISSGVATSSEIAADLGVTKQAVGKMIDELEDAGYVERRDHPDGGRRRLIALSAKGEEHFATAGQLLRDLEREIADGLPDGAGRLRSDLGRVIARMAPEGELPPFRPTW
jgi:DNA-binding MarR family transcriptional regulator